MKMANIIKIKRGLKADVANLTLLPGELGVTLDSQKLYVGDANGNVTMVKASSAGAVESANKLTNARNIALKGDATGTTSFDGSTNVELAVALANSGVAAGTYTKVTVDAKGRVTTGSTLAKADLPTITIEDVDGLNAEFQKLYGTTCAEYIAKLKLDKARTMLAENKKSIGEIAKMCGFASSHSFDKAFFRVMQITPTQYINRTSREM
jgi:phage-related tail fiber protein